VPEDVGLEHERTGDDTTQQGELGRGDEGDGDAEAVAEDAAQEQARREAEYDPATDHPDARPPESEVLTSAAMV